MPKMEHPAQVPAVEVLITLPKGCAAFTTMSKLGAYSVQTKTRTLLSTLQDVILGTHEEEDFQHKESPI